MCRWFTEGNDLLENNFKMIFKSKGHYLVVATSWAHASNITKSHGQTNMKADADKGFLELPLERDKPLTGNCKHFASRKETNKLHITR